MSQASATTNSRSNVADIYPLSPMQEGILFHTISEPGKGLYMPQTALRLSGGTDPQAMRRAWQSMVDRHPVLRTGFYWEERDEPFQVVLRNAALPWTEIDWSDADDTEHAARLKALLAANRAEPFDLHKPPLLRVQWVRLAEQGSILVICFHHLVLDGWSVRQLLLEALILYGRETGAARTPLPVSRPYGDFIGWLKKQDRQASRDFWSGYLAGAPQADQTSARQGSGT